MRGLCFLWLPPQGAVARVRSKGTSKPRQCHCDDDSACVGAARHMVSFRQSAAALARTLPRRSRAFAEVLEVHVAPAAAAFQRGGRPRPHRTTAPQRTATTALSYVTPVRTPTRHRWRIFGQHAPSLVPPDSHACVATVPGSANGQCGPSTRPERRR